MADNRLDELRRRLEKDPGSRLFAQLAEQLRKEGELEEAIGVARAGLEKHPKYPSARLTLGRALLDSGDPTAARAELDAAVQGAPDNILASRLLGEALEELGELAAALKQLRGTLLMAPGDPQIQGRIQAVEEQLKTPVAVPEAPPEPPRKDQTKPMQAVVVDGASGSRQQLPAADEPPIPPVQASLEEADREGDDEPGLPSTIRIRRPGDPGAGNRGPVPPVPAPADAAGGKDTTLEPAVPAAAGGPESEVGVPEADPVAADPPSAGSAHDDPPSQREAEFAGAGELPPTVPPRALKPPTPDEGRGRAEGPPDPPVADGGGRAPEGAPEEATVVEGALPSTVPPGLVTSPAGLDARSPAVEETPVEVGSSPEGPGEGGSFDFVTGDPGAELTAGAGAEGPRPPVALEAPDITTPPLVPEAPESARAPLPPELPEPPSAAPEPAPGGDDAGDEGAQPLSSPTLAELYLQQGLLERAIEVYREVLEAEPANEVARVRLAELEASLRASAPEGPTPGPGDDDGRAAKRQALERAIERLEALLAIVRRR